MPGKLLSSLLNETFLLMTEIKYIGRAIRINKKAQLIEKEKASLKLPKMSSIFPRSSKLMIEDTRKSKYPSMRNLIIISLRYFLCCILRLSFMQKTVSL
jgi:hypothetical protein